MLRARIYNTISLNRYSKDFKKESFEVKIEM